MGKIYQGILGGVSKRVGSVVGSSWKGIPVVRSYQPNVANPRTAKQIANRTFFKSLAVIGSDVLSEVIKPLWDRGAIRQSGYNAFIQANKDAKNDDGTLDLEKLIISKGKMNETSIGGASLGNNELELDWSVVLQGRYQQSGDKAYVVVVDGISGRAYAPTGGEVTREEGGWKIDLPSFLISDDGDAPVYVYLSFIRDDGSVIGNSYVTKLIANPIPQG